MTDNIKTYRVRTEVGNTHDTVIHVPLNQTYSMLEILSLKLNQSKNYKYYTSNYGVVVGRVQANDAVGIPNCKVSIFIPYNEDNTDVKKSILYHYSSVQSTDNDGVRYNLLPNELDEACHQDVGTFPNKRLILDNKDELEIFEEYWKYTTVTNESGDYMLYGIPTGSQQLHVDVDLSDIGIWSQRPRDMVYKGYNINLFDSPNKFKESKNLNSLSQIYTQDRGLYVYPYWGETTENSDTIGITRCDINIDYKFEPTCIFMGSIITDSGNNAIGKNCAGDKRLGKMENLTTGEGTIEMIRKTFDNKVEQIRIKGDRVINGDGVWCYQIPMNLDYVKTDEFGNLVPSDDPTKGIPTRARVRFRISLDEQPNDGQNRKRCKYLVPNNPHIDDEGFAEDKEPDYEFGSATKDESYCDLFWNKVYTVKNYIPRFQKKKKETSRNHSGIKLINFYGDGVNPMPYNNLTVKLGFQFRLICVIVKIIIFIIEFVNILISAIISPFCVLCAALRKVKKIPFIGKLLAILVSPIRIFACGISDAVKCIKVSENFCDDGVNPNVYYPGCKIKCVWNTTYKACQKEQNAKDVEDRLICTNNTAQLITCVENDLAQDNEATSFNFENDWVNGVLYAPLWYRKIRKKKKFFFGLFTRKAKDQWCTADETFSSVKLYKSCATNRKADGTYKNFDNKIYNYYRVTGNTCGKKCQESITQIPMSKGIVKKTTNLLGKDIYYYTPAEYVIDNNSMKEDTKGHINRLFATDIVLLGSLNDCDTDGIPQFYNNLDQTTYNLPGDILFTDYEFTTNYDQNGQVIETTYTTFSEAAGCDWGNKNEYNKDDGGLFYSIGCSTIELHTKSCVNLSRVCEIGVSLDESKYIPNISNLQGDENAYDYLRTDGFISYDELNNIDARSQFATLNSNNLKTVLDTSTGLKKYDFRFLYPENFDGSLQEIMKDKTKNYSNDVNYKNNYNLETKSIDYYQFRMGNKPFFYDNNHAFPRYENSFYFYFGLKDGKTAIDKFHSDFISDCETLSTEETLISIKTNPNSWCAETNKSDEEYDGYVALDLNNISSPYSIDIDSNTDNSYPTISYDNLADEKIILCGNAVDVTEEKYKKLINDGYIVKELSNQQKGIPNGSYTLTITDSGGDITTSNFSLTLTGITFQTSVDDFKKDNNTLSQEYNQEYNRIANEKTEVKFEDNEVSRKIGGCFAIYDIINGEVYLIDNFRIDINPQDTDKVLGDKYTNLSIEVKNGNVVSAGDGLLYYQLNTDNGYYFIIGVPYGGISYEIAITQLCGEYTSNNVSTYSITIDEPIKYKLYIDSVDVSIIEKGFKTGWTISGNSENPSITMDNNNTLSGWLSISDENNLNEYGEGQNLFDWNQNSLYKKETYGYNKEEPSDSETNANAIAEVKEARKEFISYMKETFYMTCADEVKDISLIVQTSSYPYDTAIVYRPEETKNGDYTSYNVVSKEGITFANVSSIDGIEVPTITYYEDLTYGGGTRINENASYTIDSQSDADDKYKQPYFVACVNSYGNTIPSVNVGKTGEEGNYTLNGTVKGYFGFHIIDKRFKADYVAWSYINSLPYYKPSDTALNGKTIKMDGLFAGYVYNGIPSNTPSEEGNTVVFQSQTLGNISLNIYSLDTNEDSIPVRRVVYYNPQKSGTSFNFEDYVITNKLSNKHQYIPVKNSTLSLSIEDTNCEIAKTIDGNLKISLLSTAANNIKQKVRYLNVTNNITTEGEEFTYYIINNKDYPYPLNSIVYSEEDGYIAKMNSNTNAWEKNNPLTLFNYATTIEYIKDKIDKKVTSYNTSTNDNGEEIKEDTKGYGNSGYFILDNNNNNGEYYVIGVTAENVRTISPLYNFPILYGAISMGVYTSKIEDGTETDEKTGETVQKYSYSNDYKISFSIQNISDNTYYFKYFPYDLSVNIKFDDDSEMTFSGSINGDGSLTADLTLRYFTALLRYAVNVLYDKSKLQKQVTFTAVDYTKLTHLFTFKNISYESRCVVSWQLNYENANWSDNTQTDKEKSYKKDSTYYLNEIYDDGNAPTTTDGTVFVGWSTDKNTKWNDTISTTDDGFHKDGDKINATTAQIWYGVWKPITVTYKLSSGSY